MFEIFRKTEPMYRVNPRFRAYGKARIDIAKRAATRDDWDQLWKKPTNPFPFSWGSSWKQCVEYKVADFPSEVGFFIDILGFPVNAFDPDYAMFTSPNGDFYFSVVPTWEGETPTPAGAIRLQFMVQDIIATAIELERRGVIFDQMPARVANNSAFMIGVFHTPNGMRIELWGFESRLDIDKNNHAKMRQKDESDNIRFDEKSAGDVFSSSANGISNGRLEISYLENEIGNQDGEEVEYLDEDRD